MAEKIFYYPYLVDGKVVEEGITHEGLPFERFWTFTRTKMSWEEKLAAAIGDDDMCDIYSPYTLGPTDYVVYSDEKHLHSQLIRFAKYNTALRDVPHLSSEVGCRDGVIDFAVFHADHLLLSDCDHYLDLENNQVLGATFSHNEDEALYEERVKELVGEIADDLNGYAWELFPSRLGKIDTALLACALLRANARAQYRRELTNDTAMRIVLGAMIEDVMGYSNEDERNRQYDLFAEGILSLSNHLDMNKFFA